MTEAFDIYIIGLGIQSVRHITREAEAAISRSKEVLYISADFGIREFLEERCPKVTDLHTVSYHEANERMDAYDTMSAKVIEAALDHPPVTFALYGHPMVFVAPSRLVIESSRILDLRVRVLPAISAMDCLFVDLELDPSLQGLQSYEATDLLLRRRPLQPDVPCLIWQIGAVESILYTERMNKPGRFSRIKQYLLQYYPPDHRMTIVHSSTHPLVKSQIVTCSIAEMDKHAVDLHQGATVYIPPVRIREIQDEELLKKINDTSHLTNITVDPKEYKLQLAEKTQK